VPGIERNSKSTSSPLHHCCRHLALKMARHLWLQQGCNSLLRTSAAATKRVLRRVRSPVVSLPVAALNVLAAQSLLYALTKGLGGQQHEQVSIRELLVTDNRRCSVVLTVVLNQPTMAERIAHVPPPPHTHTLQGTAAVIEAWLEALQLAQLASDR
jgi:hypothetical protein